MSNRKRLFGKSKNVSPWDWASAVLNDGALSDGAKELAFVIAEISGNDGRWNSDDLEDRLGLERGTLRDL